MIAVKFPEPVFRLKKEDGIEFIFDNIRKQWLVLNQEEWVRQNFIQYLIQILGYPAAFIALEKEIRLGELIKRFDILVYDPRHRPWMMVECKSTGINLNESVLQQVLRYNISVPVSFLVITNGHYTYAWEKLDMNLRPIEQMPFWK
ncbi:MAG TPA: type I restriction enzyme HsdR N-terminal domain-containing protein [Chitinophagaceae bacterium]|nr:type I restriction enzyme HsdR N-terminal domain-containing protein [Chitinophagaceae bacterium]